MRELFRDHLLWTNNNGNNLYWLKLEMQCLKQLTNAQLLIIMKTLH